MQLVEGLEELRGPGRMIWIDEEHGWVAVPEGIMSALSNEGFEERASHPVRAVDDRGWALVEVRLALEGAQCSARRESRFRRACP